MYGEVTSSDQQAYLQLIEVALLSIIFYFIQLLVGCLIFEVLLTRVLIFLNSRVVRLSIIVLSVVIVFCQAFKKYNSRTTTTPQTP